MTDHVDALIAAAEDRWKTAWRAGPTRLRWTSIPVQVGDLAPTAALLDDAGRPFPLESAWADGPALVLFWRHFGCSCGMDRARRLNDELAAYRDAGAIVVIVGQGEPERAARYRERQGLDVPILADPERALYERYGLLQGTTSQVVFDAADAFIRCDVDAGMELSRSRHGTDRAVVDDPWQLPGEFVVGADGRIRHAHRYQWCEDYPDARVHLAAIRLASGAI